MAERLTRRRRVMVARSVHPEYRQVLATYARNLGMEFEEMGYTASGQLDPDALRRVHSTILPPRSWCSRRTFLA